MPGEFTMPKDPKAYILQIYGKIYLKHKTITKAIS